MAHIVGRPIPNMPWENRETRPENQPYPMWRYSKNPIISRDATPMSNSIFNSAVLPYQDGFIGVFRCDDRCRSMNIFLGYSRDGLSWQFETEPLKFEGDPEVTPFEYRYDPRLCQIENTYYITWCNGYHGPTIGMAQTDDFKTFQQLENAFLPYNRNGVLFPRKINGKYAMFSRPSDTGHTPFGDIFYSESPDLTYWGKHRFVMGTVAGNDSAWQSKKIGPGPVPIETSEGWLLFYHGVLNSCNGFVYSFGAALLDLEQPWKIRYRSKPYLLSPQANYECVGDVPNVVFPCAALGDAASGRIAVYYGCADTVTGLAFCELNEVLEYLKNHSL